MRSDLLTWFHQDINTAEDYLALVCDPFSFFAIKFHLAHKGEFFCLDLFYCFLTRITIVMIKKAVLQHSRRNSILLFLMVVNRQPFPNRATTFSLSSNDFPIKTVVPTSLCRCLVKLKNKYEQNVKSNA